ncbi:entericidin B [Novosphingobium fluoreni]|uniref:Entericidin B n=1 Tax=Novosphingobium fluoreni TaxID=1391222 RepID=A0A7W6C5N7_9SPHN|nr:entericidin A/B family lipoprotein [Novosphingobium fluoreni]MBB3939971.1 entericidin B [Novosphingobium fluoreni]
MLKKVVFALVAGSIALSASACNTVKGAGKDVQSVGEAADRAL